PLPDGTVSSPFGGRNFRGAEFHMGLDLAAPEGTPYLAAESGTIIAATYDGGYNGGAGNWIVISHGNGLVTKYMHSSKVIVKVGDRVERGQHIGDVGNTGDSFGAHLHFQVEFNGVAVDPTVFL
ncbi:MAG: M23 family metallopeptidase, partial [Eggerthellaceae bacterium]|nr:M23 family metallopeptidase [Eggerthellaceae bacterium]